MHPEVAQLLEVQILDREAIELQEQLNRYPGVWEQIKKKVGGLKAALEKAEGELDRHQKERKRIEQRLRLYTEDLRRNQAQQSKIKTPREYEAISKQIELLKTRISQLEEQGMSLLTKDDEVAKAVDVAKEAMKKGEELYHSEKNRIRGQFNEKKQRLDEIAAERARMVKEISPEAMEHYERINKRHPGSAIASVRGGSCTGCNFQLLSGVRIAMHSSDEIKSCETCDRILSHDEDYVPVEQQSAS
jgi:predicted  nucleic acid-binding Zn-ribbon protein